MRSLDELGAKQLLASADVALPRSLVIEHGQLPDDIPLDWPVVAKALSAEISHKSEVGGVLLGIDSRDALLAAIGRLNGIAPRVLVEEMVGDSVAELLVGVIRDPQFGHYLTLGFGGTLVELIGDAQTLLLPASREAVVDALRSLRTWPLLDGFRGREKADIDAICDIVERVQALAMGLGQELEELEINPLLVLPDGRGAVAVDALVRLADVDRRS